MSDEKIKQLQPFFGKWYYDKKLGQGTFGSVYSIYHDENGVRLYAAMKVLTIPKSQAEITEMRSQGLNDDDIRTHYERQIRAIISEINIMNHFKGRDHIVCYEDHKVVRYHDKLKWEIFIRMERLERLDDYLVKKNATRMDALQMWYDISSALSVCHGNAIIHRDIKPDNILVSENGYYKLVDFGIARHLGQEFAATIAGTYPYMAPEVQNKQQYDGRADIYSLGIVVYQLLNANRYPFLPPYPQPITVDDRDRAIALRFSGKQVPPIPGVSPDIMKVLLKSIAFDPKHRYSNIEELLRDVASLQIDKQEANIPLFQGQVNLRKEPDEKTDKLRPWLLALAISLIVMALLFLLIYFME